MRPFAPHEIEKLHAWARQEPWKNLDVAFRFDAPLHMTAGGKFEDFVSLIAA